MSNHGNPTQKFTGRKLTPSASRRKFLLGTGAVAVTGTLGTRNAKAHGDYGNRVVGYYPAWAGNYSPGDVPYDKITHLNYAFLEPRSDGTVVVGDSSEKSLLSDLSNYDDTDTVFILSISSGWYSGKFSDAASTATRRQRFAKTAVDIMERYGFDGLDLDWEYPDGTIRASDPHNFTLLLEECRKELDSRFGSWTHLTMAGSPNPNIVDDAYEVGTISNYLDHVNVMTYDYHGDWSNDTNFNAPFDSPPEDPDGQQSWNTTNHMEHWASKSIAKDKLVMGMPFYGRSYSGVAPTNDGLFNSFTSSTSETYYNIVQNIKPQSDYEYHWHPDAKVPWLYSTVENTFISYDNVRSISNKSNYVKNNGFGGAMCWELSQDPSNTLIEEMHSALHS
ncbi:glycoside hydrolase family 18 protein [Haladaptatus cibarius]|uniref:glycoside hydrolase family 18 protein n=1 Tax=Haladaptatus cibarius TaxID=453847 RepID=UPI0006795189|nr:glycoside hydrolase family 18 protein [Haladaptatus cibarius]